MSANGCGRDREGAAPTTPTVADRNLGADDAPAGHEHASVSGDRDAAGIAASDLLGGTRHDQSDTATLARLGFESAHAAFFPSEGWSDAPQPGAALVESFVLQFDSPEEAVEYREWLVSTGVPRNCADAAPLRIDLSRPIARLTALRCSHFQWEPTATTVGGAVALWSDGRNVLAVLVAHASQESPMLLASVVEALHGRRGA